MSKKFIFDKRRNGYIMNIEKFNAKMATINNDINIDPVDVAHVDVHINGRLHHVTNVLTAMNRMNDETATCVILIDERPRTMRKNDDTLANIALHENNASVVPTWDNNFKTRETIQVITPEWLREMYFAQMRYAAVVMNSIVDHDLLSDSSYDEMTGVIDLLNDFHMLIDGPETTIERLQQTICNTCCDSVADELYASLFDDDSHYERVANTL